MNTFLTALIDTSAAKSLASMTTDHPISMFRGLTPADYFAIAAIVVGAALSVRLLRRAMPTLIARAPANWRHHLLPLTTILRVAIYLAALWQITSLFIIPTQDRILALLALAGLAIGFGLKDYASSLIAGVVVLLERPYRLGDRVKIGDTYGEVRAMNLRSVKVVTPEDTAVYIPHSHIWGTSVYNANDGVRTMLCVAKFYLHPEHDGEVVRERLTRWYATARTPTLHNRSQWSRWRALGNALLAQGLRHRWSRRVSVHHRPDAPRQGNVRQDRRESSDGTGHRVDVVRPRDRESRMPETTPGWSAQRTLRRMESVRRRNELDAHRDRVGDPSMAADFG